ncbi:MAG: orotidine-5'-phosphate decarboxylase [Patescibacteria group bacterium]|nr:orotidine-5'-phosphate decarboxylase [Patescibacteria group bacterium]
MDFVHKIEKRLEQGSFICVGLDPVYEKIPEALRRENVSREETLFAFNKAMVEATASYASAFKPNSAFYEAEGDLGWRVLRETSAYIHDRYPEIPVILDAKRADIDSTNELYARAIFDELTMDALTVHPYMGEEALRPFLERPDKGVIVLARTSNPGAGEFQDIEAHGVPLYQRVAEQVAHSWNARGNCCLVVGATYPSELAAVRNIVGEMNILVPGVGAQGGDLQKTVENGKASQGFGLIIAAARSIIYASTEDDYTKAARTAAEDLNGRIASLA